MAPDLPADQYKSDKHKIRIEKRKTVGDLLTRTREELFAGEFDA
jgi:tRNA (adenine-N(1)-)-methyltransferase non-catalytic subunit